MNDSFTWIHQLRFLNVLEGIEIFQEDQYYFYFYFDNARLPVHKEEDNRI